MGGNKTVQFIAKLHSETLFYDTNKLIRKQHDWFEIEIPQDQCLMLQLQSG